MRKLTALILSLAMALTLAACAPTREDPPEDAEPGAGADVSRRGPGDGGDSRPPRSAACPGGAAGAACCFR